MTGSKRKRGALVGSAIGIRSPRLRSAGYPKGYGAARPDQWKTGHSRRLQSEYGALVYFRRLPEGLRSSKTSTNGKRGTLVGSIGYGALVYVRRLPEGLRSSKTGPMGNGAPSAPRWDTETATTFSGYPKGYGAAKPDQSTTEHSRRRNRVSVPGGVGGVAASPARCIPHVRPLGRSWDVEGRELFFHPVRKGQLSSMEPATGLPRWTSTNAPGPWLHAVHPTASLRTVK